MSLLTSVVAKKFSEGVASGLGAGVGVLALALIVHRFVALDEEVFIPKLLSRRPGMDVGDIVERAAILTGKYRLGGR